MIRGGGRGVNWWPWRVCLSLPLTDQRNWQDHYPWYQWPLHPYSTLFITSWLNWIANWCVKTHVIALKSTLWRALRGGFRGEGGRAALKLSAPPNSAVAPSRARPRVHALTCAPHQRIPIGPAALGQASLDRSGPSHRLPSNRKKPLLNRILGNWFSSFSREENSDCVNIQMHVLFP